MRGTSIFWFCLHSLKSDLLEEINPKTTGCCLTYFSFSQIKNPIMNSSPINGSEGHKLWWGSHSFSGKSHRNSSLHDLRQQIPGNLPRATFLEPDLQLDNMRSRSVWIPQHLQLTQGPQEAHGHVWSRSPSAPVRITNNSINSCSYITARGESGPARAPSEGSLSITLWVNALCWELWAPRHQE